MKRGMRRVRIARAASPAYVAAFRALVDRIGEGLAGAPQSLLPIRMFVAGGAAMHFYVGQRVSEDVDAVFSRRIGIPDGLAISFRSPDGSPRMLYFDTAYNDSFGLMHEDAHDDAPVLILPGRSRSILEIHLLSPMDLAISKIARFSPVDRDDIAALARDRLIASRSLRKRALEALGGYVGNVDVLRTSIDLACRIVDRERPTSL